MQIRIPKGTKDVLPKDIYKWHFIEDILFEISSDFGYSEIRTPVFEYTELFRRGVGDTTDIVQKEMYTFEDKGGRSITLRPEGTAGVVRSFIENGMSSNPMPVKMFYKMTSYRYENVQKGRLREFNQFGAEAFGCALPEMDVEMLSFVDAILKKTGVTEVRLLINSLGCPKCKPAYDAELKKYFESESAGLCGLCLTRLDRNPMRILDCKETDCRKIAGSAPVMLEYLCPECLEHFESVKDGLSINGINYQVDPKIVRGLDYYTRTVFEFVSDAVGAQGTVCAGGRYDGLVEACGGAPTPGIGFALGIERLLLQIESEGLVIPVNDGIELYIAAIGTEARKMAAKITYGLRLKSFSVEYDLMDKSVKAQLKAADRLNAKYSVVIGDDEIENGRVRIRKMSDGSETEFLLDELGNRVILS